MLKHIVMWKLNEQALAAYKVNPRHAEVNSYCKKIRESRVVVDFYE
ncbi:Dabb family protein [Parabacteroides provencensis]|nr:Dabb family protein [Parabacteroides provencensis]